MAVPSIAWAILYYLLLLVFYRYLVYGYVTGVLDRQLLGLWETIGVTAAFAGYLILCAVPPYLWSRKSNYHPIWRGIESFTCYLLVALILGAAFSVAGEDSWSVLSGISASGEAWARIGSVAVLFAVLIAAAWWGGRAAPGRRRKVRSRDRGKSRAPTA